jgi:hypothetical protein
LSFVLSSDDENVDLFHIIKTNETPIHPTKERRWKYACIFETRKKAGILIGSTRERERGREDALTYCVSRIAKLFSDYTQFARVDMLMRQKKKNE